MKLLLATSILSAGMVLGGAAMAQSAAPQSNTWQDATPARHSNVNTPSQDNVSLPWHDNVRADRRGLRIGDMYTDALNALYSRGFRDVGSMSVRNGEVQAMALSPHGVERSVMVDPGTGRITTG